MENEEYGGGHDHAHAVEDDVVDVEAAAEYGLQQFNDNGSDDTGQEGVCPCGFTIKQGIKDAEWEEEQNIAETLRGKIIPKVRREVIFKAEPIAAAAAGHMVEKPVIGVAQDVVEKREAQEPGEITDKEGGQQRAAKGELGLAFPFYDDIDDTGQQRDGKRLQKVAVICIKEKVLEGHVGW